ncbi:pilus assembly protein TadG-related protein [Thalassoglobus sp. JC818]|uniref:pilus assembly protein TadG-related protein n=1 Tax=Thalassoglobus sp. JC818 TaxID=3232136 RepID=UPI003457E84C
MNNSSKQSTASTTPSRSGKALIFVLLTMPMILGIVGLVVDGSFIMYEYRETQHAADAGATAAALSYIQNENAQIARQSAVDMVQQIHGLSGSNVTVNNPPLTGPFAGNANYFEAEVNRSSDTFFMHLVSQLSQRSVRSRSVAGVEDATVDSALVILDPNPPPITIAGLPIAIPSLPNHHLGGLEVLGLGRVRVNGAVIVNNDWSGYDEDGVYVGQRVGLGLRHASTCTPILPLTKLRARDIYVVGGVDNPNNYGHYDASEPSPLQANRRPVTDPLDHLPVPRVAVDPVNVDATNRGGVNIINLPILAPPVVLNPGVYEYINIVTGPVRFNPGVYIIRGKHPLTQISLLIGAGPVNMNGVMFYITDNSSFTPATGLPDINEDSSSSPPIPLLSMLPSVVINGAILNTVLRPLSSPGSPYNGVSLYQSRNDRRPIVLVSEQLLGTGALNGTIYAKWGNVIFVANGEHDMGIVAASCRIVTALGCELSPTQLFEPVREVYLVE